MITTTLSTKGQLIIAKDIRDKHGWTPGTLFEVIEEADGIVLRPVRSGRKTTFDELVGCLPYKGPPKTLADMEAGIAKGARKQR